MPTHHTNQSPISSAVAATPPIPITPISCLFFCVHTALISSTRFWRWWHVSPPLSPFQAAICKRLSGPPGSNKMMCFFLSGRGAARRGSAASRRRPAAPSAESRVEREANRRAPLPHPFRVRFWVSVVLRTPHTYATLLRAADLDSPLIRSGALRSWLPSNQPRQPASRPLSRRKQEYVRYSREHSVGARVREKHDAVQCAAWQEQQQLLLAICRCCIDPAPSPRSRPPAPPQHMPHNTTTTMMMTQAARFARSSGSSKRQAATARAVFLQPLSPRSAL